MKTTTLFLSFWIVLFGCQTNDLVFEKQFLNKAELSSKVRLMPEYTKVLELFPKYERHIDEYLFNLPKEDRTSLRDFLESNPNYNVADDIKTNSEVQILNKISASPIANELKENFLRIQDRLTPYHFDVKDLSSIIIEGISGYSEVSSGRIAGTCSDIATSVYWDVIEDGLDRGATDLHSLHDYATIASNWAYVGCMMALAPQSPQ